MCPYPIPLFRRILKQVHDGSKYVDFSFKVFLKDWPTSLYPSRYTVEFHIGTNVERLISPLHG